VLCKCKVPDLPACFPRAACATLLRPAPQLCTPRVCSARPPLPRGSFACQLFVVSFRRPSSRFSSPRNIRRSCSMLTPRAFVTSFILASPMHTRQVTSTAVILHKHAHSPLQPRATRTLQGRLPISTPSPKPPSVPPLYYFHGSSPPLFTPPRRRPSPPHCGTCPPTSR
jgi:hypothetical protein